MWYTDPAAAENLPGVLPDQSEDPDTGMQRLRIRDHQHLRLLQTVPPQQFR